MQFYKRYAAKELAKGVQNLIDKIEYFDEEENILTEVPYVADSSEPHKEFDTVVRYYLLMRSPLLKEPNLNKNSQGISEFDERDR